MKRIFNIRLNLDEMAAGLDACCTDTEVALWVRGFRSGSRGGSIPEESNRAMVEGHAMGMAAYHEALAFQEKQAEKGRASAESRRGQFNHGSTTVRTTVATTVQPRFEPIHNPQSTIEEPQATNHKPPSDAEGSASGGKRFAPPSVAEVADYCMERGNSIDPQSFCDFYEARGWVVGKSKMKSWQAAVRTWENRRQETPPPKPKASADEWRQETLAEREARIRSRGPLPTREEIATMFPDLVKHFEDMKAK